MAMVRRRAAQAPALPPAAELPSVLLPDVIGAWAEGGQRRVLDLGPASGATLEVLAGGPLHLRVGDVLDELVAAVEAAADEEGGDVGAVVAERLAGAGDGYHLVLAWDLFSHLPAAGVAAAAARLARCLAPGGLLHAFVSTGAHVCRPPAAYALLAPDRLLRRAAGKPVAARVYHQHRLRALLPPLVLRRAVLLRHGMQELLLGLS